MKKETDIPLNVTTIKWVLATKYCALTGETKDSIRSKRRRGLWAEGREYRKGPDGRLWINLAAVEEWIQR